MGCGTEPLGSVNCDPYLKPKYRKKSETINPAKIPNFILCTAEALPFRDKAFTQVFCRGVLVHVNNPARAVQELIRVGKNVLIKVPHRFNPRRQPSPFLHKFNCAWFTTLLKKHGVAYTIETIWFLIFPHEIKVQIYNTETF